MDERHETDGTKIEEEENNSLGPSRHTRHVGNQFESKLPRVQQAFQVGIAAAIPVAATLVLHAALDAFARLENLRPHGVVG